MEEGDLQKFLSYKYPKWNDVKISNLQEMKAGWETDIFAIDVEFEVSGVIEKRQWICRMYPGSSGPQKAQSEYEKIMVMQLVDYPVPNLAVVEIDDKWIGKPFILMQRINGRTLWEWMHDGEEGTTNRMISKFSNLFTRLHQINWKQVPQIPEMYHTTSPDEMFYERINTFDKSIRQNGIDYLVPLVEWLRAHHHEITFTKYSFLHGDFHPGNILIDAEDELFVIDWTAARLGDYRSDLAWTLILALMHFGEEWVDLIYDGYKSVSGHDIQNLDYFKVEAAIRRFSDILISVRDGPQARGMRKETIQAMRASMDALTKLHNLTEEITGIRINELDRQIQNLS